jgi:hypothetical protein
MSLNGFNGQPGRPKAHADQDHAQSAQAQPSWQHSAQQHSAPPDYSRQQHWPQGNAGQGYPQQGYGAAPQGYGQPQFGAAGGYGAHGPAADPYAPNFQPYDPNAQPHNARRAPQQPQPVEHEFGQALQAGPSFQPQPPQGYGQTPHTPQWAQPQGAPQGYDPNYLHPQPQGLSDPGMVEPRLQGIEPTFSDWQQGYAQPDPQAYDYGAARGHEGQGFNHDQYGDMGFAQSQGGELDQAYADEDGEDYEFEEPPSGRRPLMIVAALAGAILVGGGMAYGYKAMFGGGRPGDPPVVKTAGLPTKIKPADAGGKVFDHTDSKIMGRLGDGSGSSESSSSSSDVDANGTRRVATLVVGRDGSIQAPPAEAAEAAPSVAVPGMMVVDALGPQNGGSAEASNEPRKVVVTPPPEAQKPVTVAKAQVLNSSQKPATQTGSLSDDEAAPVQKPAVKKVASIEPANTLNDASRAAPVTSNGYVAVLASVPKSQTSRMDALKQFADLQQKYGEILSGKTPDVAEADLGAKGAYHRLVVGPPGSRRQASSLCTELKAKGYKSCWVTTY